MKPRSDSLVVVDKERAKLVLRPLHRAFMERKMLFAHVTREADAPQRKFFPEGVAQGSIEHRRWLFFAAMTDRRQVSELVYESHTRLRAKEPGLYLEGVLDMSHGEVADLLRGENIGAPAQIGKILAALSENAFRFSQW